MSGGAYNYAYGRVEELAHQIREQAGCRPTDREPPDSYGSTPTLRKAFKEHLLKVACALRAIEWNDSGDGDSDEPRLIRACIAPDATLSGAVTEARDAVNELIRELERARGL